jgi:hypothetical protein
VHQIFIEFKKAYDSVRREVIYNTFYEFGIPMKLVRLIEMCLIETYSRECVSKNLSDMLPIRNGLKQGDAIWTLLFNYALKCTIRRVQVIQDGLKLNGTHADDVNILGGSVNTIKENAEAFIFVSKETGLEENAGETKYMTISRDQNDRRNHSIKNDNNSFERVEEFEYFGTILTNQNYFSKKLRAD